MYKYLATSLLLIPSVYAENTPPADPSKAQIEAAVKDLLKREPELIEDALRAGMAKKEAALQEAAKKTIKTSHKELFEDPADPVLGNPKGSVAMVVFMDPYCGYCRKFQKNLLEVAKKRKDLKIIYKAYPILSPESIKAAEEELASNNMGRFQDFHEAIYESSARTRKDRLQLAEQNRIDTKELMKQADSKQVEKQLKKNMELGQKLGIRGTPAFILGDDLNPGFVEQDDLIEMLDQKSKKS